MQFVGISIWKRALTFYIGNFPGLVVLFPLLCIPVVADVLNTQLISQFIRTQSIAPKEAIKKTLPLFLPLLAMKIYFFGASLLWSLVPVYGIIPVIKHRQNWAMASNVLVFEGLYGLVGRERCRHIFENSLPGMGIRTLVTIPSLLIATFLLIWLIGGSFMESFYSSGFWVFIIASYILIIPLSGAVNTYLYLHATRQDLQKYLPEYRNLLSSQ